MMEIPSEANEATVLQVVAGVVCYSNKIMLARRAPGKHLEGFWEFPGGKVEQNETHQQSLTRELLEELGLAVRVGDCLGSQRFEYPDRIIELHAYLAEADDICTPGDSHDAVVWVFPNQLPSYLIAPADAFIVKALLDGASPIHF